MKNFKIVLIIFIFCGCSNKIAKKNSDREPNQVSTDFGKANMENKIEYDEDDMRMLIGASLKLKKDILIPPHSMQIKIAKNKCTIYMKNKSENYRYFKADEVTAKIIYAYTGVEYVDVYSGDESKVYAGQIIFKDSKTVGSLWCEYRKIHHSKIDYYNVPKMPKKLFINQLKDYFEFVYE